MIAKLKSYGYLIGGALIAGLALVAKLLHVKNERLTEQRDQFKAQAEHHSKVAHKQAETRKKYQKRKTEVTRDEKTVDDRLSRGDDWVPDDDGTS